MDSFPSQLLQTFRVPGLPPNRRMGLLQRLDRQLNVLVLVELSLETEAFIAGEGRFHKGYKLSGYGTAILVVGVPEVLKESG